MASNTAIKEELKTAMMDNEEVKGEIASLTSTNSDLRSEADTLISENETLAGDVEALVTAAEDAAAAALIEDYFTVNAETMTIGDGSNTLAGPFCIDGPGILKFELSLTE